MADLHVVVDLNFNISLPGVLPFLSTITRNLMALQDQVAALTAQSEALTAAVESARAATALTNDKADALILAHSTMADELAALRGTLVDPATIAALDAILATQAASIAKAQEITAAAVAQGAENDGAAAIVA
jgi:hypothetical protein